MPKLIFMALAIYAIVYVLKKALDDAKKGGPPAPPLEIRRSPYRILGLEEGADEEAIHEAYTRLMEENAPDRVTHLNEDFKNLAERLRKNVEQAYRELVDEE